MSVEETSALLLMNRFTNYTARQKYDLMKRFGSARGVLASKAEAEDEYRKPFKINGTVAAIDELWESVERELASCADRGIEILAIWGERYPARLAQIGDPPLVLFAKGRTDFLAGLRAVALVGSRRASNAGLTHAYRIAGDLSREGAVVVSGLASGVDAYVHRGVLDSGGATIAVLGNGLDVVYPKENAGLYDMVAREGCLLSEYPLGTGPLKQNFPRRNRIISGLSAGVLVIEAGESSGALITAAHARAQGRIVMALPGKAGSVNFAGNNRLIKEGARLVEDASDVLACIEDARAGSGQAPGKPAGSESKGRASCRGRAAARMKRGADFEDVSPLSGAILRAIGDDMVHIDAIERILGGAVSDIASELTLLELRGLVVQHPGKIFSRAG